MRLLLAEGWWREQLASRYMITEVRLLHAYDGIEDVRANKGKAGGDSITYVLLHGG